MLEKKDDTLRCKVIFLGEKNCGKTSIIHRCKGTIGAGFISKKIFFEDEKQSIIFDNWDMPSQKIFRTLNKIFYESADVFVLVYDISKKSSFDELKNFWIKDIKENAQPNVSKK